MARKMYFSHDLTRKNRFNETDCKVSTSELYRSVEAETLPPKSPDARRASVETSHPSNFLLLRSSSAFWTNCNPSPAAAIRSVNISKSDQSTTDRRDTRKRLEPVRDTVPPPTPRTRKHSGNNSNILCRERDPARYSTERFDLTHKWLSVRPRCACSERAGWTRYPDIPVSRFFDIHRWNDLSLSACTFDPTGTPLHRDTQDAVRRRLFQHPMFLHPVW